MACGAACAPVMAIQARLSARPSHRAGARAVVARPSRVASLRSPLSPAAARHGRGDFKVSAIFDKLADMVRPVEVMEFSGPEEEPDLRAWLAKEGLPAGKLGLRTISGEGRGLVATQKIGKGEPLLQVPAGILLTADRALELSAVGPAMEAAGTEEWAVLAVYLAEALAAAESGEGGPFAEYVLALPRVVGGVLEWREKEVSELLQGSPFQEVARARIASVDAAISDLRPVIAEHPNKRAVSAERLRWAFGILFSRLVRLTARGEELALVPWADMANHSPAAECFIDYDEASKSVVLRPDRDYRAGEEVFASYGQRPSGELLLSYGFVPRDPVPYESVELTIGMDPNDSCYDQKVALLAKWNMEPIETIPIRSDSLPSGLLQYAAFVMSPAPAEELDELARASFVDGDLAGGEEGEMRGRELILESVKVALSKYGGSMDEDRALSLRALGKVGCEEVGARARAFREAAAATLRLRERQILSRAESVMRTRLREMKTGVAMPGAGFARRK